MQELQSESFNPILFYKPQGCESELKPFLKKDSFLLAIQTEFQMDLYQQFSHKILCIDATHSTNAYRFKLITCLVQDDFSQGTYNRLYEGDKKILLYAGQPIAWCISDQETTEVVQIFFQCIKDRSPHSNVTVLMTDDGKMSLYPL